jgi:factor associated with neutral sphingomyelinase activation
MLDPPVEITFEPIQFLHVHEQPLSPKLKCIIKQPLLEITGIAVVTDSGFYFQRFHGGSVTNDGGVRSKPFSFWSIRDMKAIARRYDGLKDVGLEIYLGRREGCANKSLYHSILLSFESIEVRDRVVRILMSQKQDDQLVCFTDRFFVESALQQWQSGQLDNFSYLLVLNSAAGRTFHDLSRYPVFPWVLSNYSENDDEKYSRGETTFLDLTDENNFRDLSKPIGALNEERFVEFKKRYDGMAQQETLGQGKPEKQHHVHDSPFMFGTHYSSPGYVLFYLLRVSLSVQSFS